MHSYTAFDSFLGRGVEQLRPATGDSGRLRPGDVLRVAGPGGGCLQRQHELHEALLP